MNINRIGFDLAENVFKSTALITMNSGTEKNAEPSPT